MPTQSKVNLLANKLKAVFATKTEVNAKANLNHTHNKSQITDFPTTITMTVTFEDNTSKNYTIYGSEN